MAYGLRYTITQALRDDTTLIANIYKLDYSGSIKTYTGINITLNSNSSGDEPLPSIVSSQLNISFITSEEDAANDFPNLLSFNEREYFVKLYNGENLLWCGFLFNDYAQMPDEVHLTINGNHPIYQTLLKETNTDKQQKQARNLADLALLSQGLLKGAELTSFINRSVELTSQS